MPEFKTAPKRSFKSLLQYSLGGYYPFGHPSIGNSIGRQSTANQKLMGQVSWQPRGNLHKNIWACCLLLWNSTFPEYWCSTTLTAPSTCRLHCTAELWTVTRQRRKQLPLTEASTIPHTSRWKKCDGVDYQHCWMLTRTSVADSLPGEFLVAIKGPTNQKRAVKTNCLTAWSLLASKVYRFCRGYQLSQRCQTSGLRQMCRREI